MRVSPVFFFHFFFLIIFFYRVLPTSPGTYSTLACFAVTALYAAAVLYMIPALRGFARLDLALLGEEEKSQTKFISKQSLLTPKSIFIIIVIILINKYSFK